MREINIQNLRAAFQSLGLGSNPLLDHLVAAANGNGQADAEDEILTEAELNVYLARARNTLQELRTHRTNLTGALPAVLFRAQENNLSPFTSRALITTASSDLNSSTQALSSAELEQLQLSFELFLRLVPDANTGFERAENLNQTFSPSSSAEYTSRNQDFYNALRASGLGEDFNFNLDRYTEPRFTLRHEVNPNPHDENFYADQYRSQRVLEDLEKMDQGYAQTERLFAQHDGRIGAANLITERFGLNLRRHYTQEAEQAHRARQAALAELREILTHPPQEIANDPNILTALEYLRTRRPQAYEILNGPQMMATELYGMQSIPNRSDREWARFRFVQRHLRAGLVPLDAGFPNIQFAQEILEDLKEHAIDSTLREEARFLWEVSEGGAVHNAQGEVIQEGHAHFGLDPSEWFQNASDEQRLMIEGDAAVEIGTFIAMGGVFKLAGYTLRYLGFRAFVALAALGPEASRIPPFVRWMAKLGGVESRVALAATEVRIASDALRVAARDATVVAERRLNQAYLRLAEEIFHHAPSRTSLRLLEYLEAANARLNPNTPFPILLYRWASGALRALPIQNNLLRGAIHFARERAPNLVEGLSFLNTHKWRLAAALGISQGILRYFSPRIDGTQQNSASAENE